MLGNHMWLLQLLVLQRKREMSWEGVEGTRIGLTISSLTFEWTRSLEDEQNNSWLINNIAFKHQLTVDGHNGKGKNKKRLKAIQHCEIKMPIYIDNLIFFFFSVFTSRFTLKDHKYFIVDWIRLEALWKHQHSWWKLFSFHSPAVPATATTIMIFNWENVDILQ